ncbi:MAG: hypothetical protein DMG05_12140 [Acidobacteria bacterium]|nr:MAG: hypothetical protein DMG05_12140 [Acidobacteriota bacterium]
MPLAVQIRLQQKRKQGPKRLLFCPRLTWLKLFMTCSRIVDTGKGQHINGVDLYCSKLIKEKKEQVGSDV